MTKAQHDALIKQLEDYKTYGDMMEAILKMDDDKKLFCVAGTAYSIMTEEKQKEQMKLFISIISHDLSIFKNKKEKMQWYKAVYHRIFTVKEVDDDTYDIGVDHDSIHNFIVDRLDLN
jgi:hypothetical protein